MIKSDKDFRNYDDANEKVRLTYKLNHCKQTMEFVKNKLEQYCTKFDKCQMSIWDAIEKLNHIVDESDPDLDAPQIIHAFQTAEKLRERFPNDDWLHLIGLIHDLGKVLLLVEFGANGQWEVVGDTYPVGCAHSDTIVYPEYFNKNPDSNNPLYQTQLGIYEKNCGLSKLKFSFGHDEYMYQVLIHNKCSIPQIGLNIIRYHSFYPWHKYGAYGHLESPEDLETKKWCQIFSECDLYTKSSNLNYDSDDLDNLKLYYQSLIEKYFPNDILEW